MGGGNLFNGVNQKQVSQQGFEISAQLFLCRGIFFGESRYNFLDGAGSVDTVPQGCAGFI